MTDTPITQSPFQPAADAAGRLPPRGLLRLKEQFPIHDSGSIEQTAGLPNVAASQKKKIHMGSIKDHEQTAKNNPKPNTKSPLIDPRNRLIDP